MREMLSSGRMSNSAKTETVLTLPREVGVGFEGYDKIVGEIGR
jgi:hypothetical protein